MLELLVVHKRRGTVQTMSLHRSRLLLGAGLVFLVGAAAAGGLHHAGYGFAGAALAAGEDGPEAVIRRQSDRLTQLQRERDELARRLAAMEARLFRIEAVGERLSTLLDVDPVDFGSAPGVGGAQDDDAAQDGPEGPDVPAGQPISPPQSSIWRDASDEPEVARHLVEAELDLEAAMSRLELRLAQRAEDLELLDTLVAFQQENENVQPAGRPIREGWLSSGFGRRADPFSGKPAFHRGVDFSGRSGSDVIAVASGVVTFAGNRGGYGRTVEVLHGAGLKTRYAHNKRLNVRRGDVVERGQAIAQMGSTGRSTATHVHFEVIRNGKYVNPMPFVRAKPSAVD